MELSTLTRSGKCSPIVLSNRLVLILAKIVDDLMVTREEAEADYFKRKFGESFKLGSSAIGPGRLQFFRLTVIQNPDLSSTISGDDKIESLEVYPLTRVRHREQEEPMNELERSGFMNFNSSIGWLGFTASTLCAFYARYLEQQIPSNTVSCLTLQSRCLRVLKQFGTDIVYQRPQLKIPLTLSVCVLQMLDRNSIMDNFRICAACY